MNIHFSKENIQVVNRHRKVFKILTIREMQIRTTMRHHLPCVRMAGIKKSTKKQHWLVEKRMWRKGKSCALWCSHCGTQHGDSSENKNRASIKPSNSTSQYLYKENKNSNSNRYMHPSVH